MTIMPFVCLGAGVLISLLGMTDKLLKWVDWIVNGAVVLLMLTIGMNIGSNDAVMKNLPVIGVNCVVISLCAMAGSVLLVVLAERTILPLDSLKAKLLSESLDIGTEVNIEEEEKKEGSPLVWGMPLSIAGGVVFGFFLLPESLYSFLDISLYGSLILLYTGVGISLGNNRKVFGYVRLVGFKILFIPMAIFVGSLTGGMLAGFLLKLPIQTAMLSAGGMSYYSITGAYMTQTYGIEIGTYGFMVNVMREFFTVLLLPLLIRVSKGSPIAAGAAGNMDTMLVPVTKFVGAELGLIALITGVILTFFVPFELPVLAGILERIW